MHHLIYSSTASVGLDVDELQGQLGHWLTTNARLNITGLLLYSHAGHILQVLEGEAALVHGLYAIIAADIRHRSLVKLADGPVPDRAFAKWSMQFRPVDVADFLRLLPQLEAASDHLRNLLPLLEAFMAEEPLV